MSNFVICINNKSNPAKKLTECARKQGVPTETLINVWLTEKVTETSQGS